MTKWISLFLCFLGTLQAFANPYHQVHDDAERDFSPNYLKMAYGDLTAFKKNKERIRYIWPVSVLSIGHTNASYQRYSFMSSAYFHHGIDIRADAGSDVIASAGGKVVNIENYMPGNDAYWEVAILDEYGFIWQYHHIERQSIPESIFQAFKNKTSIPAGAKLGEVYFWGIVTYGERFHHVHLNVLGKNKAYLNPLEFLELLPDHSQPEITNMFLVKNGAAIEGNTVSKGNYSIGAEVTDLILSEVFIVPPHEIKVSVDGKEPFLVWKFSGLPGGDDTEKFVNQFYLAKLACGDYNCRKPVVDLGFNKDQTKQVFPLNPGNHRLQLWVKDYNGNEASQSFQWLVTQ
jgi:hypothetical protein